jgi:hypothetical protein
VRAVWLLVAFVLGMVPVVQGTSPNGLTLLAVLIVGGVVWSVRPRTVR